MHILDKRLVVGNILCRSLNWNQIMDESLVDLNGSVKYLPRSDALSKIMSLSHLTTDVDCIHFFPRVSYIDLQPLTSYVIA